MNFFDHVKIYVKAGDGGNGAIAFQLSVFKLSYKEGYFQQFMMSVLVNLIAGAIAVVMAMLLY